AAVILLLIRSSFLQADNAVGALAAGEANSREEPPADRGSEAAVAVVDARAPIGAGRLRCSRLSRARRAGSHIAASIRGPVGSVGDGRVEGVSARQVRGLSGDGNAVGSHPGRAAQVEAFERARAVARRQG